MHGPNCTGRAVHVARTPAWFRVKQLRKVLRALPSLHVSYLHLVRFAPRPSSVALKIERLKKLVGRKGFSNNPAAEISDVMKLFEGDMAGLQRDIASLQR